MTVCMSIFRHHNTIRKMNSYYEPVGTIKRETIEEDQKFFQALNIFQFSMKKLKMWGNFNIS